MAVNNSPTPSNNTSGGVGSATSVGDLSTAEKLAERFRQIKSARSRMELQWKLNLAFYNSKQWSYIDRMGRLQVISPDVGDKPRHRVMLVSNQIVTGAQSLLSKYTKTKPIMSSTPGSSSDHDLKAAQMAEDLLEYWWQDFQMGDLLEEAMLWGIIGGQGYWKITWDEHAGKPMRFLLDPNGNPITDQNLETQFRGMLSQRGIQPQEQVVYMGDIKVEALSPFQVYLDPVAKTFKDCKYAICVHYLDPEEVKTRWGKKVTADSVPVDNDQALPFDNTASAPNRTVKTVYEAYFLPNASLPNGRYVVWTESPYEILQDEKWPYPMNVLPLVKFPGVRVPGRIYDSSPVEHAIPLQKELNKTLSQIVEYKNLTIRPRVWAPVGSLRTRLTNEPGAVYEYTPIGGQRPEVEKLPSMPPYVFDHLEFIAKSLKDVFSLTEVSEGTVPPNVEAGIAIDLLQEMSTDRVAPTIRTMEAAIARAGQQMLSLAQKYYIEPRLLKIEGSGGGVQVRKFTQADIDGNLTVHVEAGSGLPRTRAGRQARIESYIQMGLIKPDIAWKYLDVADLKGVAKTFQQDEDMAFRENDKMVEGIPLNELAMNQAKQLVMSNGVNPNTGAPFQSAQEAMQYVNDAGLEPFPFENWGTHLDVHGRYMKSIEFETLDQGGQQRFITHFTKTFEMYRNVQPIPEAVPIKTSLQLRGTVGPTVAAEILNRNVPNITPEQMAEPPLDTIVQEIIQPGAQNEPDPGELAQKQAEASQVQTQTMGNTIDNLAKAQSMSHAEELHQQKLVEGAHKIRKAQKAANQAGKKPSNG